MNTIFKKVFALFLAFMLSITCFAACDKKQNDNNTDYGHEDTLEKDGQDDQTGQESTNTVPWIVDALKEADNQTFARPYSDDLAFVRIGGESYYIDRTGNPKFTVDSSKVGTNEQSTFHNGLVRATDCLINTNGEVITAEDLGGTALKATPINEELFAAGYIVVEKVSSGYAGSTYEAAIYNAKLEQTQPYSEELYAFFEQNFVQYSFYNGYIICDTQTYHIETGTYGEYRDLAFVNKMDLTYFSAPVFEPCGMYRNEELVLDLSAHETLIHVEFIGDKGLAIFENEQNQRYFTIMDESGNLRFDPVCYVELNMLSYCQLNGDVIQTYGYAKEKQNGKDVLHIRTYDLEGNLLGSLDEVRQNSNSLIVYWGSDSVVVENENIFTYYDMNLKPIFPSV